MHHTPSSETDLPPSELMLCRASEDLKTFARPGLHNNANRCYMNSLMQQFGSLVSFREQILSVPLRELETPPEEEGKEEAKGGGETQEAGTWKCNVCTFDNDVGEDECSMCGSKKPEVGN